jgi:drug/metabolite transporter (DMT)-like permease
MTQPSGPSSRLLGTSAIAADLLSWPSEENMKPSATHKWLVASVMGVLWAITTVILWALLALAFGRSKSDFRLITVLILGAVTAVLLAAHAYSEGWRHGSETPVNPRKDSKP